MIHKHNNSKPTTPGFYELFSEHGMGWLPAKWIWLPPIPNKHQFFIWLAFQGRLNSRDNTTAKPGPLMLIVTYAPILDQLCLGREMGLSHITAK
jgi:hypothetical protein